MEIAGISIGSGKPLALIAGLNVIESEVSTLTCAEQVAELAARHGMPAIFKASYDKANRTRADGFRGPGIDLGLEILARVGPATGLPVLTDVHESEQAKRAAEVVDALQVPAMLCRQTDLLAACAATGKPVNLKKGQFIAAEDFRHAVEKLARFGCQDILVTERGTHFGYGDLVVDFRSLVRIREYAPVCFDATHSVQRPGQRDGASGGDRLLVAPLARAAVASGVDALFIEIHPNPDEAPVDGPCQLTVRDLDALLTEVRSIEQALDPPPGTSGPATQR
ncbi:MAG: 3-deoxy-8-phosphooctulonate synthase [Myxococcota bacterium]